MKEINWRKGFFRLTAGLSVLLGLLAGAKAEDSFELGWTNFLAPFVKYFFDLKWSTRTSEFDSEIFWAFFVVYSVFIWILYAICILSANGFIKKKKKSQLKRFFSGILINPTDRTTEEDLQD